MQLRPALIVDPDTRFLQSLLADPSATSYPPELVTTGSEAKARISDLSRAYSGIFVSPRVRGPDAFSVIRAAHLARAGTPIFLMHENGDEPPLSDDEMRSLAVQESLEKPLSFARILSLVQPVAQGFDSATALALVRMNHDPVGAETSRQDDAFVPILAQNFLSGRKSFFDVYVRLASGRYLKIVQGGDEFDSARVQSYLQKNVRLFFIRKETQEQYLRYCDHLTKNLSKVESVPIQVKSAQVLNLGQETLNYLRHQGLNSANLQEASRFSSALMGLTTQPEFQRHLEVRELILDLSAYEHGVSAALITSLLLHGLKSHSDRVHRIAGLASLFHDIGLQGVFLSDCEEDPALLNAHDRKIYQLHPLLGAQILGRIDGIDPITTLAIAQHHERRDGGGFPRQLGAGAIHRLAELTGISEEFATLIRRSVRNPAIEPMEYMEKHVFDGFSFPVIQAFREVFLSPRRRER